METTQLGVISSFLVVSAASSTSAVDQHRWKRTPENVHQDFSDSSDFGREEDEDRLNRENYFQEIYVLQSAPKQIEFGHVCENPHEWEQRYERKDFNRNRHQGKVRWADKKGRHGEHYWDYNHSGSSQEENPGKGILEGQSVKHEKRHSREKEVFPSDSQQLEQFLNNFNRQIENDFRLEMRNRNLFSDDKLSPFRLDNHQFPFIMHNNNKPKNNFS